MTLKCQVENETRKLENHVLFGIFLVNINLTRIHSVLIYFKLALTVVSWYKSDIYHTIFQAALRFIPDDRFISEPDHSLVILNTKVQDQGSYHCNVLPENITMKANLEVLPPLQAHIYDENGTREITDRSRTYNENDRIAVECKASGSRNKIDFKWSTDGNRLTSNNNLKLDGGKLTIEKATYDDVRVFQCLADDGIDGVAHATFNVNVRCKY